MAIGTAPEIQTLLLDDFSAPVSSVTWDYNRFASGGSFYGRTQQRQELPTASDGILHLELDSYNPTAPAPNNSFVGSEIISNQTFSTDAGGIAFEVSARVASPVAGLVGGLFLYSASPHNEIDFELLGNDAAAGRSREETNIYSNEPLGVGNPSFVSGADLTSFHTYRIEWFSNLVRWFVDGQLVREDSTHVPQGVQSVHLNIWAPDTIWPDAYAASLAPATTSAANTSYFVDVDYVKVARLDTTAPVEPQSTLPVSIGGTATISTSFLWSFDDVSGPDQVTYTVLTAPIHGTLVLDGCATNNFTQADIDNGLVQYRENGDIATSDGFTFQVADAAGNHTSTEPYTVAIVDTTAPVIDANDTLPASVGSPAMIWKNALCTVALGSEPTEVRYSVLTGPAHGILLVEGAPTDSFTQAEIDDHRVQYLAIGDAATYDSFTFQATDAAGDQTPLTTFNIAIQSASPTQPDAIPNLALLGQYAAAGFATAPDQGGGLVSNVPTQIGTTDPTLLSIPQH